LYHAGNDSSSDDDGPEVYEVPYQGGTDVDTDLEEGESAEYSEGHTELDSDRE
jgi:hypothetical protein